MDDKGTPGADAGAVANTVDDLERKGLEILASLGWGENEEVREIDEDLWRLVVRNNFGTVWSRPGLSLKDREMVTIAALVALGARGVSKHFEHAGVVGLSAEELKEIVLQVMPLAGLPRTLQAMHILKSIQAGAKASL